MTSDNYNMENELIKLKLSKVLGVKTPAFLLKFTNGRLNFNCSSNLDFKCCRSNAGENEFNSRRILIARSNRLAYRGSSNPPNLNEDSVNMRYFLGVKSKNTNRMKVYDAVLVHMKPCLNIPESTAAVEDQRTNKEKWEDLAINFSTKTKQRTLSARLKYEVSSATADGLAMANSFDDSKMTKLDESFFDNSNMDYMPPQNSNAYSAEEVYNISDIISPEEDEDLNTRAPLLLDASAEEIANWKEDAIYGNYVLYHIEKGTTLGKMKYLIYYTYLIQFSKLTYIDVRKKDPAPSIPEPYRTKILQTFTSSSVSESGKMVRLLPLKMKDKLFAYLIVLALFIDNFTVNLALVAEDVKCSILKLANIAEALGCHISQKKVDSSVIKFAELKLPLAIPKKFRK